MSRKDQQDKISNEMRSTKVLPVSIAILQLLSLAHLYYSYKYGSSQFPVAFIELNILALVNLPIFIMALIYANKSKQKSAIWLMPATLAFIVVLLLTICYIVMLADKYD